MKVLLVDDDDDVRVLGQLSLRRRGWEVVVAADGPEALEVARRELPDALLLDVQMPGWDGPETLAALRQEPACAAIPVVFLTAQADADDVLRYRQLGAMGVIGKPFAPLQLPELLLQALGRA